jgi:hypothetical protein
MPGPLITQTSLYPEWTKPENASVFDPVYRAPIRKLISLLGLDDPQQVMAFGTPLEPAGAAAGGLMGEVATRFPRFAKALKAYHGSPQDFQTFDMAKAGTTTDVGHLGKALYFSTDPRVAAPAAHRYEVALQELSPLRLELPNFRTDKAHVVREALGLPPSATANEVTAAAQARGYNSVVLDYSPTGYQAQEIAVFDDKLVDVLKKYGIAATTLGAGAHSQAERH